MTIRYQPCFPFKIYINIDIKDDMIANLLEFRHRVLLRLDVF